MVSEYPLLNSLKVHEIFALRSHNMKSYKLEKPEMCRVAVKIKDDFGYQQYQITADKRPWKKQGYSLNKLFFFVAVYHQVHHKFSLKYVNLMKFQVSPAPLPHNPFLQWSMWTSELSVSHGLQPSLQRVGKHRFRYKPSKQCSAVL